MPAYDVSDHDFDDAVIARSHQVPVLVDFWAPWCGPCRMLGPVLERLSDEYAGRVEVVKLNTDDSPSTSQRYRVSSIPAVKLFKEGAVAAELVGAQPEPRVRAFLDEHCPGPADQHADTARQRLDAGDVAAAAAAVADALALDPKHPAALLVDALVALRQGRLDDARRSASAIPASAKPWETAQAVLDAIALARLADEAGGLDAARARVAANSDDLDARLALAGGLVAAADHRAALDELLAIVERDRRWKDEAARKAMLTVFAMIGVRSPLSDEYRRKLSMLL